LLFLLRAPNRYTKLLKNILVYSIRNVVVTKNKSIELALNKKPIATQQAYKISILYVLVIKFKNS
jgi:hypothetical protein